MKLISVLLLLTFFLIKSNSQISNFNGRINLHRSSTVDSLKNPIVLNEVLEPQKSEANALVRYAPIYIPLLLLFIQQYYKRRDDKITVQLKRLNSQLSELYGPLYAWYEIGRANFESYSKTGNQALFTDSSYSLWLKEVFMRTNNEMETIIIKNTDLFVGQVPKECLKFCQHVAALNTCLAELKKAKLDYNSLRALDDRVKQNSHPRHAFQAYIVESFKILKEEQARLLSSTRLRNYILPNKFVNENELYMNIKDRYLTKADSLERTALLKSRIHILPFTSERTYETSYKAKISASKIRFEIIKEFKYVNGKIMSDQDFLSEDVIEYDEKGNHVRTISKNKKGNTISTVESSYFKGLCCEQTFYDLDKKVISKAKFFYYKEQKSELRQYDLSETLDYLIKYSYDDNGAEIEYEKLDNDEKVLEKIKLVYIRDKRFFYKWYDAISNEITWERVIEKDSNDNTIKRTDIDPKSKKATTVFYNYVYDDEGFVQEVKRIEKNGEPQIMKIYERKKFE